MPAFLPGRRTIPSHLARLLQEQGGKKSQINIPINYPATFVYALNVATVYLSFKLLLSSIEQSILSYKIYHREIAGRCSSRNVRFLN